MRKKTENNLTHLRRVRLVFFSQQYFLNVSSVNKYDGKRFRCADATYRYKCNFRRNATDLGPWRRRGYTCQTNEQVVYGVVTALIIIFTTFPSTRGLSSSRFADSQLASIQPCERARVHKGVSLFLRMQTDALSYLGYLLFPNREMNRFVKTELNLLIGVNVRISREVKGKTTDAHR